MNRRLKTLYTVLSINIILFLAELIVSIRTGSVALKADAFHVLSDLIAIIITIYSIKLTFREKTPYATYGWLRSEIIGGLINSVFLLALAFNIFIEAIEKLIDINEVKNKLEDGINEVFIVGIIGLCINLMNLLIIHHGDHHVHHKELKSYISVSSSLNNISLKQKDSDKSDNKKGVNSRGLWLHIIGDILGSVVVVISASTIKYSNVEFRFYLDPSVSLLSVIIICIVTFPLLFKCRRILLHHVPKNINMKKLQKELDQIKHIENIHELHIWQLDDEKLVGSMHFNLVSTQTENVPELVKETIINIKNIFHKYGIHSTTIQPEFHIKKENTEELVEIDISECLTESDDIHINIDTGCIDILCDDICDDTCNDLKCCDNKKQ